MSKANMIQPAPIAAKAHEIAPRPGHLRIQGSDVAGVLLLAALVSAIAFQDRWVPTAAVIYDDICMALELPMAGSEDAGMSPAAGTAMAGMTELPVGAIWQLRPTIE